MRLKSLTTVRWLGVATLIAMTGCDGCGNTPDVDAGGPIDAPVVTPDAFVAEAQLTIDPALADFGDIVVGQTSMATEFTVTNEGTGASASLSATFGGSGAGDFSFDSNTCAGMRLDPGDSCTISVEFSPDAEGGSSATLTVSDGDADATATLEGNGAAEAGLAISPTPFNFGDAVIGTASSPNVFTVENIGEEESGTITISISGLDATQFDLGTDSCSGVTLTPGETCTVEGIYDPSSSGLHMGTLQATASPGSTATAALQGRASSAASLRLLPGTQGFGTIVTGTSSSTVDFTLTNTGGVPTGTISHTFTGPDAAEFSVTSSTCAGAPLDGGDSCTITVRFNAATAGAKMASLDVTDGTLNASATLTATGVTPGAIIFEPPTRNFGTSAIGVATGATTFTLRNTGGSATTAITVAVAGTNPADFPIVAGGDGCSGAILPAAGTCTVAVLFNPTVAGARAATLRAQAATGTPATSDLTGNGESLAVLEVTPTAADFGSVATGSNSATVAFTVTNTGGGASGVPAIALTGVQSTQFNIVSNGCTAAIPGGGSCMVTVRFSPTTTGIKTAVLNVSGTPGGTDTSDLSGTGITPAALGMTPSTATFGTPAELLEFEERTFVVTNSGMEASALAIALSGPDAAEFSIRPAAMSSCGASLGGGLSCNILVRYSPVNQGASAATLTVTGTPGGVLTAGLSGVGDPDILIVPTGMDVFNTSNGGSGVIIGQNATRDYTITNNTALAMTAFAVASPTGMMEFTRVAVAGDCTGTLAAGASCTIRLQFAPTGTAGARSVNLTLNATTTAGAATETLAVTGTARGALRWTSWQMTNPAGASTMFAIPPTAALFGDRPVGSFYDMRLTLTNQHTSASMLVTMAPTFTGDMNLQNDLCTGTTVVAGGTCTVTVRFYPRNTGAATGALVVTQGGNTATANITANGIVGASITVTPPGTVAAPNDFGTVIATASLDRTFTVTNTGSVPTANLNVPAVGALTGRYSVVSTTCPTPAVPLAPAATCNIVVRFSPSQADNTAPTNLTSSFTVSQGVQAVTTNLTGRAGSQLTLTPATAAFVTGVGTTSATTRFTVTNVGAAATGSIIVAVSPVAGEFPITNSTCSTLAPAATCTFDVAFAPTANVDRTGVEVRVANGSYVAGSARSAVSIVSGDARSNASLAITPANGTLRYGLFYGFVPRGTNSATYTFTVRNSGDLATGALTPAITPAFQGGTGCITGVPGGNSTDFWDITATTCSGALAGGASCTVTIRTSPPTGTTECDIDSNWTITDGTATATARLSMSTPAANTIFMTPAPADFGSIVAGTSAGPITLTVTNAAAMSATITVAPASTGSFAVTAGTCTVGRVLAPGDACTFTASYNPPVGGPFGLEQGFAIVRTNIGFQAISGLTGISLRPAGLNVTPADATPDFATTVAGETRTITYTVANLGDVSTMAAPAVSVGGADPSQFVIANNTCTAALTAAGTGAASSCSFDIRFTPSGAGARAATLNINAGGAATHSRALTGTGIGAALLGISPSAPQTCADRAAGTGSLDFGVCTTYTITNGGGSPSQPLAISVTGDFRIQANSTCIGGTATTIGTSTATGRVINDTGGPACGTGSTAACGATCTVIVQHAPQTVGADSGTLTVGAAGIASVTGTISSNGISAFQHSATSPGAFTVGTVAFGTIGVGTVVGGNQVISYLNRSDPATGVMTYTITGANAADFDMQNDTCSGGTFGRTLGCATTIRFLPSAVGARTATVTVTDGTPEHTAVVTLTGTGS